MIPFFSHHAFRAAGGLDQHLTLLLQAGNIPTLWPMAYADFTAILRVILMGGDFLAGKMRVAFANCASTWAYLSRLKICLNRNQNLMWRLPACHRGSKKL
jgi:hypothetical protein